MHRRRGYTLMELLLVLAILVVAAAASAPALHNLMRSATLRSAADTVRTQWTRAHVKAMKTGRIQAFRYELGDRKYMTAPLITEDDSLEGASNETTSGSKAAASDDTARERDLPEGTKFAAGDALAESRSVSVERDVDNATQSKGNWSRPILFYPDGSSSDAFVVVANDRGVGIRVELRGMTGTVSVGEIRALKDMEK